MTRAFFLLLLLLYYWYFYAFRHASVSKPSVGKASSAPLYHCEFKSDRSNHFRFVVNQNSVWEHALSVEDHFTFHAGKIVRTDPCHKLPDDSRIPAWGKILYDYLKLNPEIKNFSKFKANSNFTIQEGLVFYFECSKGRIRDLQMCPSGTTLVGNACQNVNSCTGKPDGTLFPHPIHASKFVQCLGEKENVSTCPDETIFYHNRCESVNDLVHYCKMFPNAALLYDEKTRVECRNGKPEFYRCKPGTRFFKNINRCEPAYCVGKPDGETIPLPERHLPPFKFVPGYMTCRNEQIDEIVECPQTWDDSAGDNLTFLPTVFHAGKCSIPTFCENVFSDDPDVIVPVHEFTRYVKNWNLSKILDSGAGYACENNVRKRKHMEPGTLISKRFKAEPACVPPMPEKLPIYESPDSYYDCVLKRTIHCSRLTFFNGSACVPKLRNAFEFKNLPLFQFDSLNFESWIKPWDYSKKPAQTCSDPESSHVRLYNICSHPDCADYAFASQIPDMTFLLPREHRAKCKFYEGEQKLKKEPVDFKYDFWTQKVLADFEEEKTESCTPGQKLQTGNFIWDTTVFSTCDTKQPFVFCPSAHSRRIIPVSGGFYACEPPVSNSYMFNQKDHTLFERNELKRIFPYFDTPTFIQTNKAEKQKQVPADGLDVSKLTKINLQTDGPLLLEPQYRVTHPPNVAFEYDDDNRRIEHTSAADRGFLVKLKDFTNKSLSFPRYTPIPFVESFEKNLHV